MYSFFKVKVLIGDFQYRKKMDMYYYETLNIKYLDIYFQSKDKKELQELNLFKRKLIHNATQLEGIWGI